MHKCVKPARTFLNQMLELLCPNYANQVFTLTPKFMCDLRWFSKFLAKYKGVSIYNHRAVDHTVELDACLLGLSACYNNYVYALSIPNDYLNLAIMRLKMLNVLLAVRVFGPHWYRHKILIKCSGAGFNS